MTQAHGARSGYCRFCGLQLPDKERSVNFGYGPICARHWALPWGKVAKIEKPKPPIDLNLQPIERVKPQFEAEALRTPPAPIADADRLRTVEFAYQLAWRPEKEGKIVAQVPAHWLIIPRPNDQVSNIRDRLATFLNENGIRFEASQPWRLTAFGRQQVTN